MIRLENPITWEHHRSGWKVCVDALRKYHDPGGVLLIGYLEQKLKARTIIHEPWYGIFHNTVRNPPIVRRLYMDIADISLENMLENETWKANYENCRGIFVLANVSANYLRPRVEIPVWSLTHATGEPTCHFSIEEYLQQDQKMVLMIGHWMRNFQSFFDLKTSLEKCLLCVPSMCDYDRLWSLIQTNDSVKQLQRLEDEEYDQLLSRSIVFLDLFDCGACNTVLECILRNTPVLVNRLPALEEYLGHDYPFFYKSLEEAGAMSEDTSLVRATHEYLTKMPKAHFSPGYFADSLADCIRNAS